MERQKVSFDLTAGSNRRHSHSDVLETMKSRYSCIYQPVNPTADVAMDRRYLIPLHVFGARDIYGPESPLPPSFSGMMVEPSTIDPHSIKERITSALKEFRFRDKGVLVQFWSPVAVRNRWLLTTWDQPFGISGADEGLYSFRLKSELHAIVVGVEDIEELRPPGRVYSQKLPEWSLYVDGGGNKYGYIDLPIFESSSDSCVGVLEIITSSSYADYAFEVQEVSRVLKNQNLKSPRVFEDPALRVADKRRRYELDGILKVLMAVCDDQKLPLAQTWALSGHASFVANSGNIEHSCSSFNRSCIGKVCMSTYDLPFYVRDLTTWDFFKSCRERHLENSQGVVGRSFSSRGSWFCRDVTELDEGNYPLVCFARVSGLASCLAIYIKSLELGVEYVIEFFLPTRSTDDADVQRLMKSVKQNIQNASCMQLDVMSAPQVIGGHPILSWDLESPPSPIALLTEKEVPQDSEDMEEDNTDNEASNSLTVGTSQSTEKEVPQDSEDMEEDNTDNEDSNSLTVGTSQSTAPYLEHGIGNFDTNPGTVRAKGKHVIPTRANPPDETIVATRVENVLIKATYEKNTLKFSFHILDGLVKLKNLIATRFQLKRESFRLKYRDEDGDMISILCDDDLSHAILSTSEPPYSKAVTNLSLRLTIVEGELRSNESPGADQYCRAQQEQFL